FTPDDTYEETGYNGPDGMKVSRFDWQNADNYCNTINYDSIMGWRLPTKDELVALYDSTQGGGQNNPRGMWSKYGWPTSHSFWSSTLRSSSNHYSVSLHFGNVNLSSYDDSAYHVSCVR
ncbi:DUF1566 domain-containing protein, partial [Vibrio sp. F13]|uniref:Lcl C-terminal domain-containing protein n=1 Tax=Vibrio sp. F13 TaxID=2070777 RepID=UPI0010BE17DB